jgi:hypothetical protein
MSQVPAGSARRAGLATASPVLAAVASIAIFVVWRPRLPDRLASHFGPGGRADDFVATGAFPFQLPGLVLGLGLLFGTLAWTMRGNPQGQRLLCAASGGVGLMMLLVNVLLLRANLDVRDPATVVFPGWIMGVMALSLVVGGAAGWISAGHMPVVTVVPPDVHEPQRVLARDEPVCWRRRVTSPPTLWTTLGMLPLAAVTSLTTSWWMLTIFVPILALLAATARADVILDDEGLHVRLLGGWPHIRVRVSEIRAAHHSDVRALGDFGGWGWRANRTATGLVLRSGPAL